MLYTAKPHALHRLNQFLRDGEADAGAFYIAVFSSKALKRLE